jgi:hypothetical protein
MQIFMQQKHSMSGNNETNLMSLGAFFGILWEWE